MPDDQDSVNFVLGTIRYDPLTHQPHFPGYPVYIALCKIAAFFSGTAEKGAVNLSIVLGAMSIYLAVRILKTRFTSMTAVLCGILLSLNPVFFEFSHKIFSEITALALLLLSITILKDPGRSSGRRWFAALTVMGLLSGARLSWWPFPFVYLLAGLLYYRRIIPAITGSAAGVLIWLVPQTTWMGLTDFIQTGTSFTYGHFTMWGGAVGSLFAKDHRSLLFLQRLTEAWGLSSGNLIWLSVPWSLLSITGMLICFRKLSEGSTASKTGVQLLNDRNKVRVQNPALSQYSGQVKLFFIALAVYLVWVFLGQNPDKVRHLIPLIPGIIIVTAPAVERFFKPAVLAAVCLVISLSVNYSLRNGSLSPYQQFREWASSFPEPDSDFFCGPSERYFDLYPVRSRVVSVKSIKELAGKVNAAWPWSTHRFVCDDIPGFIPDNRAINVFPGRKGDPVDRTLKIYELL